MNSFVHLSLPDDVMVWWPSRKGKQDRLSSLRQSLLQRDNQSSVRNSAYTSSHSLQTIVTASIAVLRLQRLEKRSQCSKLRGSSSRVLHSTRTKRRNCSAGFYDHLGLLVDFEILEIFEIKTGFNYYARIRNQIQFNIKH